MVKVKDLIAKFQFALDSKFGYIWGTAVVMWTEAKQRDLEKTTDDDRAQGRMYGSKWIGHYVADCSGLFTWAFRELGSTMYHGSDTMYRKWCTDHGQLSKGKRTDGKNLLPGSAVFCWNGTKYSHVGLYIGKGEVIEAAGTQQGVIKSSVTNTKWKYWGELKDTDFSDVPDDPQPEPTPGQDRPTLRRGSKGEYVILLQTMLVNLGYDIGATGVDGDFGRATEKAVRQYQTDWGLVSDGICGPKTWSQLDKTPDKKLYKVTVNGLTKAQADAICKQYPGAIIEGSD